ncbi:MAG: SprT family zinc-dependent metalloprotease [Novosphingobium sp.]
MLDWLRRDPREEPAVEVGGRVLPVQIRRNERARRLTMRLSPDGAAVLITVPRWIPTREALAFAAGRIDWLERQAARIPAATPAGNGTRFPFRDEPVTITHDPKAPRRVILADGQVRLGGTEQSIATRIVRWMKSEAQLLLAEDLAHYCAQDGRDAPALSLSSAQRRWGSCSARGALRINWRLIMAPDMVRRSVVAHEVAHLTHFDHSPAFKAHLARLFEHRVGEADRWLKREGRALYGHFG